MTEIKIDTGEKSTGQEVKRIKRANCIPALVANSSVDSTEFMIAGFVGGCST